MQQSYQQRTERTGFKGVESYPPCVTVIAAKRRKPIYVGYNRAQKNLSTGKVSEWLLAWRPAREADLGNIWNGPNGKIPLDKQRRYSQRKRARTITKSSV